MHDYEEDAEDYEEDWDEDVDTISCPNCAEEIYDESQQCPLCGHYIVGTEESTKPTWVIITAIILLVFIAIFWLRLDRLFILG